MPEEKKNQIRWRETFSEDKGRSAKKKQKTKTTKQVLKMSISILSRRQGKRM